MNKIILGILFIFLFSSCQKRNECNYIENYYQPVYLAEKAYYIGNYQEVFEQISKATENCELINQRGIYEMLKFAESAAHIGKNEKAYELIKLLILNGYELSQLENNEAFQNLVNTKEWTEIENEYDLLHKQYLNSIDLDLREKISDMKYIDQYHRIMLNNQGIDKDSIWQIISKTDSINEIKLKNIVEKYGYPDERIIGRFNIDNQPVDPGILLFHFNDYEYWTTRLKELIINGQAPPSSLGNFVDSYQRRVPKEKKFIYGIYGNAGEEQIIDFDKLDERRVSIGLAPIKLNKTIDSLKRAHYGY